MPEQKGTVVTTDKWDVIVAVIKRAHEYGKRIVIVDDFQHVMSNEFMRRSEEKSFDKFTEIGRHAWEVIKAAQDAPDDLRVYFLAHTEETPMGRVKMKTIGKMLDEKITVEGMFTIVLRTLTRDDQFFSPRKTTVQTLSNPQWECLIPMRLITISLSSMPLFVITTASIMFIKLRKTPHEQRDFYL